jgi:hypothetical protein
MTVHTTITAPTRRRRGWLVLAGVASATIVATVAVLFAAGKDTRASVSGTPAVRVHHGRYNSAAMATIMSLSPTRFAAGALGLGYALPSARRGPSVAAVIASMSPATRRQTEAVMSQTFAQLAAGAAGSP